MTEKINYEAIKHLKDEQLGKLFRLLCLDELGNKIDLESIDPTIKMIFEFTRRGKEIKTENEIQKIVKCYQQNIGLMNPITLEKLNYWLEDFTEDIICKAIEEASLTNKRNYRYINGILNSWFNSGVKALADIEVLNKQHEEKKKKPVNNKFINYNQREYDIQAIEKKALELRLNSNGGEKSG